MKAEIKIPKGWRRLRRQEKLRQGDYVMLGMWQAGVGLAWTQWNDNYAYLHPGEPTIVCIRPITKARKQ